MKAFQIAGLMPVMFMAARLAGAQLLTQDVAIPLGTGWNTGGATIVIVQGGAEGEIRDVGGILGEGFPPYTTTSPGDIVLVNPTGGNDPSNWAADLRFFNPLDPMGVQGLPATKIAAFSPADLGSGGFGSFKLFPHYNLVPAETTMFGDVIGITSLFGPVEGILPGQLAVLTFIAHPVPSVGAVPEPGALPLVLSAGIVGAACLCLRKRHKSRS